MDGIGVAPGNLGVGHGVFFVGCTSRVDRVDAATSAIKSSPRVARRSTASQALALNDLVPLLRQGNTERSGDLDRRDLSFRRLLEVFFGQPLGPKGEVRSQPSATEG